MHDFLVLFIRVVARGVLLRFTNGASFVFVFFAEGSLAAWREFEPYSVDYGSMLHKRMSWCQGFTSGHLALRSKLLDMYELLFGTEILVVSFRLLDGPPLDKFRVEIDV